MVFMTSTVILRRRLSLLELFLGLLAVFVTFSGAARPADSKGPEPTATAQKIDTGNSYLITLTVTPSQVNPGGTATCTATTSRINNNSGMGVGFSMSGTAINGTDYTLSTSSGQIFIKKGTSSRSITLTSLSNSPSRGPKTATMTLLPGSGYQLSTPYSGSVTINFPNPRHKSG